MGVLIAIWRSHIQGSGSQTSDGEFAKPSFWRYFDGLWIYRDLSETFCHICRDLLLIASIQLRCQKFIHRRDHRKIVDRAMESMSLIRGHEILDSDPMVLYGSNDLIALALVDTRIIGAPARPSKASGSYLPNSTDSRLQEAPFRLESLDRQCACTSAFVPPPSMEVWSVMRLDGPTIETAAA